MTVAVGGLPSAQPPHPLPPPPLLLQRRYIRQLRYWLTALDLVVQAPATQHRQPRLDQWWRLRQRWRQLRHRERRARAQVLPALAPERYQHQTPGWLPQLHAMRCRHRQS